MSKKVLITGADKGLGLALTKLFLEEGFHVFSCLLNEPSNNITALRERFSNRLNVISMNVGDDASVKEAAKQVRELTDSIDILINNAGIHPEKSFAALEEVDFNVAIGTLNVNTLGPLRVTSSFFPLIKKGETKVVVNISSEAGSISQCSRDREFDYCMSKAALNMQSVVLQNYFRPQGIKVLAVHPGWLKTDMGGVDAEVQPDVSARGIFNLINKYKGNLDSPIYMDYAGNLFNW